MDYLLLKFGGSAITDKTGVEEIKGDAIKAAAQLVKTCYDKGIRCFVVHGGGSFGHPDALEFNLKEGFANADDLPRKLEGFSKCNHSVAKLNLMIVDEFIKAGIPASGHGTSGSWRSNNGQLVEDPCSVLYGLMNAGLVPVVHGGMILDYSTGSFPLSSDVIIQTLHARYNTSRVVYLTDVLGVFDKPPRFPDARLLEEIYIGADGSISLPIHTEIRSTDATGGMELKLKTAANIVRQGAGKTKVFVCNADAATDACLLGNFGGRKGTVIMYKKD